LIRQPTCNGIQIDKCDLPSPGFGNKPGFAEVSAEASAIPQMRNLLAGMYQGQKKDPAKRQDLLKEHMAKLFAFQWCRETD
jgi:hypothetical protein